MASQVTVWLSGQVEQMVGVIMIEVGSRVRHASGEFEGRVLGRHGSGSGVGGSYEYRSLPENLNVQVYWVVNDDSGEVRAFVGSALELVKIDES